MILRLLAGIGSVEDVLAEAPDAKEVQSTDLPVGFLGSEYRAVFTMAQRMQVLLSAKMDELNKLLERVRVGGYTSQNIPVEIDQAGFSLTKEISELELRHKALMILLLLDMDEEFDLPDGCSKLEVRKGWQVVGVKKSQHFHDLLSEGLGLLDQLIENLEKTDCGNPNCGIHGITAKEAAEAAASGATPA